MRTLTLWPRPSYVPWKRRAHSPSLVVDRASDWSAVVAESYVFSATRIGVRPMSFGSYACFLVFRKMYGDRAYGSATPDQKAATVRTAGQFAAMAANDTLRTLYEQSRGGSVDVGCEMVLSKTCSLPLQVLGTVRAQRVTADIDGLVSELYHRRCAALAAEAEEQLRALRETLRHASHEARRLVHEGAEIAAVDGLLRVCPSRP